MNPTVYTQSDTTHRCRGADFSFWVQGHNSGVPRICGWGVGSEPRRLGIFFVFFVVVNILFLRILTHFFHKPHCLSWQMNQRKQKS